MNLRSFKVGQSLDGAGLVRALGRHGDELADMLVPDLRGLDAAAVYESGTLRIEAVGPAETKDVYRLRFRFDWSAQHGCSDWSCGDTEHRSAVFRYVGDEVIFEVSEISGERQIHEEF